ncbi:MAG TPA: hypothetical protein VGP57_24650 [Actinoplanes sp.]|nr:hypothetical protein [Actinoplanes sp.]
MDVRAATRRTRLPFVASVFLAALLGVPAAPAPAVEPVPISMAAQSAIAVSAAPAADEPITAVPADEPVLAAPAAALPDSPALRDQAVRAALAPRAPPLV